MYEKLTGIVLTTVKHNDRTNITTIYTDRRGRVSFAVAAGAGRRSGRQRRLMPLSIVDIECRYREEAGLQIIHSIEPRIVYRDIYFNPVKNAVAIFIVDFLNRVMRETQPDMQMWSYIADSLLLFDGMRKGIADFHLAFLCTMAPFLGLQPDTAGYRQGAVFDMVAGCYTMLPPAHRQYIAGRDAEMPMLLQRINYANIGKLKFSRKTRNELLDKLLEYYSIHIPGLAKMKSVEVLRAIFD